MPTRSRVVAAAFIVIAIVVAASLGLLNYGVYGWTLFVLAPMVLGGMVTVIRRPSSGGAAALNGAVAGVAASCLLLFLGLEGLVCIVMALPLTLPLGALGGWLAYLAGSRRLSMPSITMLLLLTPLSLAWDTHARPPLYAVRTQMEVAASPEQVWKYVVAFPPLSPPHAWYFRAGMAYPMSAHIDGSGPGAVRYCEFSTGAFVEPIEVWDEPHLLRFRVTANPAPLREWSPYGNIQTKHLHGYLVAKQGQFLLTSLPNGHTLLVGTTWYQHGLWPGEYWRWWSDAIIHRIHLRVLNHIKALAESDAQHASPMGRSVRVSRAHGRAKAPFVRRANGAG